MYLLRPTPYPKTNAIIIIVDITKLIASLVTTDIGSISLGNILFLQYFHSQQ